MNLTLSLPVNTWRVIHAIVMEDPVPRRMVVQAIAAFEAALQASQTDNGAPPQGQPATGQPQTGEAATGEAGAAKPQADATSQPPAPILPAARLRKGKRNGK